MKESIGSEEYDTFPFMENFKKFVYLQPSGDYATEVGTGMLKSLQCFCNKSAKIHPVSKELINYLIDVAMEQTREGHTYSALRNIISAESIINKNFELYEMK